MIKLVVVVVLITLVIAVPLTVAIMARWHKRKTHDLIAGLDQPELWLSKRERRQVARDALAQEKKERQDQYQLEHQQRLDQFIYQPGKETHEA